MNLMRRNDMSDSERKDMSGSLFKNEKKEKEEQPDYNGGCKIRGEVYVIAGWINTSKDTGKKYIGFKFQTEEEAAKYKGSKNPISVKTEEDLPF
jgi:uncharacterized protein (DUF736 family)